MPESTVQWKKENLRFGSVQICSMTYVLFLKMLLRHGLLAVDTPCSLLLQDNLVSVYRQG